MTDNLHPTLQDVFRPFIHADTGDRKIIFEHPNGFKKVFFVKANSQNDSIKYRIIDEYNEVFGEIDSNLHNHVRLFLEGYYTAKEKYDVS